MPEVKVTFDAAEDYERLMGRWSRAIGSRFLDWLAPPAGANVLRPPMRPESTPDGATAALQSAGFRDIAVTLLEATRAFRDFDDYWDTHCLPIAPPGQSIAALTDEGRAKLQDAMRAMLPAAADGSVSYSSRALAFKAHTPA